MPETGEKDLALVIIYINIGFEVRKGVNFVSFVFAPDYDNYDPKKEFSLSIGTVT